MLIATDKVDRYESTQLKESNQLEDDMLQRLRLESGNRAIV